MIKIKKQDSVYKIWDKIVFVHTWNDEDCDKDSINLMPEIWAKNWMLKQKIFKIEFPGEYDKEGIYIKAYENKWELNYAIVYDDIKLAIINSPEIIENVEIDNVDRWLYTDEKVSDNLDKLEIKWKKVNLNNI